MKRIFYIIGLLFFFLQVTGQTRDIHGSFSTSTFYTTNQNQQVILLFSFPIIDGEFIDSLNITFPAGCIVTEAPTTFSFLQTEGQQAETLNGSLGTNTISYGDNDNTKGGIEPGEYTLPLTVFFPSSLNGQQTIYWDASGDENGNAPHSNNGSFIISPLPAYADLKIQGGTQWPYTSIPVEHADSLHYRFSLGNSGNDYVETGQAALFISQLSVVDATTFSFNLPFQGQETYELDFQNAPPKGNYTVTYQYYYANDINQQDNKDTLQLTVSDSTFYQLRNSLTKPFPYYQNVEQIGQLFTFPHKDTITSARVQLQAPSVGDSIQLSIYSIVNNSVQSILFESPKYRIPSGLNSYYNFNITDIVVASSDTVLVALDLSAAPGSSPAMGEGLFNAPLDWYYTNGEWKELSEFRYDQKLAVQLNVGKTQESLCNASFEITDTGGYFYSFEPYEYYSQNTYSWFVNGSFIENSTAFTYNFNQPGTYEVCLQVENTNCQQQLCDSIEVVYSNVNAINAQKDFALLVYPNPTNGENIFIQNTSIPFEYVILDVKGQVMSKGYSINKAIPTNQLNAGLYFLKVVNQEKIETASFVVQ